jgi:hypothetical protein
VIREVKVVVHVNVRELASQHQAVSVADEDGFDLGEVYGLHGSLGDFEGARSGLGKAGADF